MVWYSGNEIVCPSMDQLFFVDFALRGYLQPCMYLTSFGSIFRCWEVYWEEDSFIKVVCRHNLSPCSLPPTSYRSNSNFELTVSIVCSVNCRILSSHSSQRYSTSPKSHGITIPTRRQNTHVHFYHGLIPSSKHVMRTIMGALRM